MGGVTDEGKICGVQSPKTDQEPIAMIASTKCDPPLTPRFETIRYHAKNVLLVELTGLSMRSNWIRNTTGEEETLGNLPCIYR